MQPSTWWREHSARQSAQGYRLAALRQRHAITLKVVNFS